MGKGSGIAVLCDVVPRHGLDLVLLWLWGRPAAVAPIRPLAWEPPYAAGMALKSKKKKWFKKGLDMIQERTGGKFLSWLSINESD